MLGSPIFRNPQIEVMRVFGKGWFLVTKVCGTNAIPAETPPDLGPQTLNQNP